MFVLSSSQLSNLIATALAVASVITADYVNKNVTEPYLDEIFHIPQVQQYCSGDFQTWDPKLTTPPGLYLASILIHRILPITKCRDVAFLRSTNLLMLMCIPHIISALLTTLKDDVETKQIARRRTRIVNRSTTVNLPPDYLELDPHGARSRSVTATLATTSEASIPPTLTPPSSFCSASSLNQGGVPRSIIRSLQEEAKSGQASPSRVARRFTVSGTDPIFESKGARNKLSKGEKDPIRTATSHIITFLPPLWFFGFLYYTDVGSLCFVLATFLAVKKDSRLLGFLFGASSLFFRQTNIIWLTFILASDLLPELERLGLDDPIAREAKPSACAGSFLSAFNLVLSPSKLKSLLVLVMSKLSVYLPIFATFLFFLRWNGGIVLGDKANHVAALHLPQLFYFVTFSTFFAWPALLATVRGGSPLRLLTRSLRGLFGTFPRAITTLCLLGLMLAAIDAFTIEHPFLLADNRHYTFYLWRRVVKAHPLAKFALAPVYLLCGRLWIDALGRTQSLFWMLGFVLATCLTLVPSPLLEPRYFIVPFVIMRAHLVPYQALVDEVSDCREEAKVGGKMGKEEEQEEEDGWMKWNHVLLLMIEGLWYAAINAVTMYVFLNKPFKWPSEEGWQRFMW